MTTSPSFWWSLPHYGSRLVDLEPSACRDLLLGRTVGRLAYVTPGGPRVVPVNYVVAGNNLVWRMAAGSEPARHSRGRVVAFEVDHVDELRHTGWSVEVVGMAQEVSLDILESLDVTHTPHPWPEELRDLFLHLPLKDITGRAVPGDAVMGTTVTSSFRPTLFNDAPATDPPRARISRWWKSSATGVSPRMLARGTPAG